MSWHELVMSENDVSRAVPIALRGRMRGLVVALPLLLACSVFALKAAEVVKTGTGFAVGRQGRILTNGHVVSGCSSVVAMIGGLEMEAQTVFIDGKNDLALLRVSKDFSAFLPLREGTRIHLGEQVTAFGFPLSGIISASLNVTTGNISSLAGLGDDTQFLQFTNPTQPGNSGGPLVDASGNVVGVVTEKLSAAWAAKNIGDLPQNVNFALKASVIRDFLESRDVEFQARALGAAVPATDLSDRVKDAVFPLRCFGPEASNAGPYAVARAAPAVEKRPGVLIAGYGSAESFQPVFLELENSLASSGVLIANRPSVSQRVVGDAVSIQNLLSVVQRQGSDSLLYVTVEHSWSNVRPVRPSLHHVRIQCFDAKGNSLWEEDASSATTPATSAQSVARSLVEQLGKKLRPRVGKPGLVLASRGTQ